MTQPSIVATGLICLDVLEGTDGDDKRFTAGGCINLLMILQQFGWDAIPVARLGNDRAASLILQELELWRMNTRYIERDSSIHTPVYRLRVHAGGHRFEKHCSDCKQPFPPYQPVPFDDYDRIKRALPAWRTVCYVDKVSEFGAWLVRDYKQSGAFIVFEPNRIDDVELFREILDQTDILKYSRERRGGIHEWSDSLRIPLEIETAGRDGLFWRTASATGRGEWKREHSLPVRSFHDAAGAGDWLTAMLVHALCADGNRRSFEMKLDSIDSILRVGQTASAQNCRYPGARGLMYQGHSPLRGRTYCPYCENAIL